MHGPGSTKLKQQKAPAMNDDSTVFVSRLSYKPKVNISPAPFLLSSILHCGTVEYEVVSCNATYFERRFGSSASLPLISASSLKWSFFSPQRTPNIEKLCRFNKHCGAENRHSKETRPHLRATIYAVTRSTFLPIIQSIYTFNVQPRFQPSSFFRQHNKSTFPCFPQNLLTGWSRPRFASLFS